MKHFTEKLTRRIPLISLLLSATYPWLMINNEGYAPYLGFALILSSFATLIYFNKTNRNKCHALLYGSILLLSAFLTIRAAEFLFFHNVLSIFYIGSLLILSTGEKTSLLHILFAPPIVLFNALRHENKYPYKFNNTFDKKVAEKNIQEHIPAIILTGILFLIVVPLLSSANPVFNKLVHDALEILSIEWLFKQLMPHEIFLLIVRLMLFLIFLFFIPRLVSLAASGNSLGNEIQLLPVNYLIPKIALTALLVIFFFTQAQLYFASSESLLKLGYTNSQQTREVFAQLSIVAVIVFFLIYVDRAKSELAKILTYVLIVEAFFLCGIALKSVYDYTTTWGFTHKRLYGFAAVVWVVGMFLTFLYHFMKRTSHLGMINIIIGYTIGILLFINVLNFDYIIFHFAKSTTHTGIDHLYLSGLSSDAHSYRQHLPILMKNVASMEKIDDPTFKISAAYSVLNKIEMLQKKYSSIPPIGSFNIAEYQEYLDVKDIDVKKYYEQINKKQQVLFEPYQQTEFQSPYYPQ